MFNIEYMKNCLNSKITISQAGIGFVCAYIIIELVKSSFIHKKIKSIQSHSSNDKVEEIKNNQVDEVQSGKIDTLNSSDTLITPTPGTSKPLPLEVEDGHESESDDDDSMYYGNEGGIEIKDNYTRLDGPFKLMLCVNTALNMGKGKIGAQCGHATLGAYKISSKRCQSALKNWSTFGQAKICVKIDNDEIMHDIASIAQAAGLVTYIVEDAGRTQIAAGSQTVLAIGPAPEAILKTITGQLKLL